MRVLFNTYPWAFATPGGGEMQLRHYLAELPRHGVEVVLHDVWKPAFDSVDAVHFFSCVGGSVHFCDYVQARGLPLVVSSSLWITPKTTHQYPTDEIRAQLQSADVIVPNSGIEAEMLSQVFGMPRQAFMPVLNGFALRFAEPHDPERFRGHFGLRQPFVLNVANIEPRKNQLTLIRAMRDMDLPLMIIGHVRDDDYARQVFSEAGTRVRYLGPLGHTDPLLASAYAAASVFALPSTLETPGLAALEAAAVGAPLVVTSEGSTSEYFGRFAHYVNHADPDDIRRGIEAALAAGPDPRLRTHVRAHFTWPTVTAALVEVYREAIGRCHRRNIGHRSQ